MKTYTITKENRISNSPFTMEGSNMEFDITNEVPLPPETTTFDEKGKPKEIRLILGCETIDKQEQIKMGYPAVLKPSEEVRRMLTFFGGMCSIPEDYKVASEYLELAPWFKEKKGPRPVNSRIIYEVYDQDEIDRDILAFEKMVNKARDYVLSAKRDQLDGILRLAQPGAVFDQALSVRQLQLRCLDIANNNPDFILKAIDIVRKDITVLVSKAVDYGILNLDTTGAVHMKRMDGSGKLSKIANVPDVGGRHQKVERTVSFLQSEDGKRVKTDLQKLVDQYEIEHELNVEDDDELNEEGKDEKDVKGGVKKLPNNQEKIPVVPSGQTTEAPIISQTTEAPQNGESNPQ